MKSLLADIEWRNDEAFILGKVIVTKRKAAWYGDRPFQYTYSRMTKTALPWNPELLSRKIAAEKATGETYNSCLLNLYHTGEEGMAWHSDGEPDLKKNGAIASLSSRRRTEFRFQTQANGTKSFRMAGTRQPAGDEGYHTAVLAAQAPAHHKGQDTQGEPDLSTIVEPYRI
ncbi:MAG: alpha-ketoglutarate-dependent dioxygenase AlkB [Comamonadaceae bacterium]|nr:alpha-ketoglutarate-dependent dioxygenase AlkB [Comamonadaceae bacterium]